MGQWQFDPEEPEKPTIDDLETELFMLEEQLDTLISEIKVFEKSALDKKLDFTKQIREMNIYAKKLMSLRDNMKREISRLQSVLARKDEYILELQQYRAQKDAEIKEMKDNVQSGASDDMQTAIMKNEINMLRVQMESLMDDQCQQPRQSAQNGGWGLVIVIN